MKLLFISILIVTFFICYLQDLRVQCADLTSKDNDKIAIDRQTAEPIVTTSTRESELFSRTGHEKKFKLDIFGSIRKKIRTKLEDTFFP